MANLVSYVITTFNSEDCIEGTLECLINQDYENKEIIVVDDNSDDDTVEVARRGGEERTTVISLPRNFGHSGAVNIGFANATGEFILLLDDDVTFEPAFTRKLLNRLREEDDAAAVNPHNINTGGDSPKYRGNRHDGEMMLVYGNASLIDREAVEDVGYFDERFFIGFDDHEYGRRLVSHGYRIVKESDAVVYHANDPETDPSSPTRFFYNTRNQYWTFWKYYPLRDAVLFTARIFYKKLGVAAEEGYWWHFLKANLAALKGAATFAVRERNPSDNLSYRPWTLENIVESVKRELKELT
ncbi:MAG: glycosyltransferase family 2 protein [Candidatus Nanohaloarchaea archaeon]